MRLVIDETPDRREMKVGDSVLFYTPCGYGEWLDLARECRSERTMLVDEAKRERLLIERHFVGWDVVVDGSGKPVPFSLKAAMKLSPTILGRLTQRIVDPVTTETEEQGNSEGSSSA